VKRALRILLIASSIGGCANLAPSVAPVPSTSPPATEPQTSHAPAADPWQLVELPNADAALNSIAVTDHDVVIVGAHDVDRPAAWWQHDSGPWTSEPLPAESGTPGRAERFGDRVLVMGGMETSRCAHPAQATFVVRDVKGQWAAAPFNDLFCAASGSVNLAVQGDIAAALGTGTGDQPFGWFSHDGLRWVDSGLRGDLLPQALSTADGDFVALGTRGDGQWWFGRTDGTHSWGLTAAVGLPADLPLRALEAGGAGVIAWFADDAGHDGTFTSVRGDVWRAIAQEGRDGTHILSVRLSAGRYIAIAEDATGQLLLASADGASWRRLPRSAVIEANGIFRDFIVSAGAIHVLAQSQPDAPIWLLKADVTQLLP
jgi:hypothetical protein